MNYRNAREYTCRLLELMDDGVIEPNQLVNSLVQYMSESEVKDFCLNGDFYDCFSDDSEDE